MQQGYRTRPPFESRQAVATEHRRASGDMYHLKEAPASYNPDLAAFVVFGIPIACVLIGLIIYLVQQI